VKDSNKSKWLFFILSALLISISSCAQNDENWHIHQMDSLPLNETSIYVDKPTISGTTYNTDNASILKISKYDLMLFIVYGNCTAKLKSK
jgi:hypothetical protein